MAVLAQQYWLEVGVEANLEALERSVWGDAYRAADHDLLFVDRRTPNWDPDVHRRFYSTDGGSNYAGYSNQRVDELLNAAAQETDPDERRALYQEYDAVIFEDAAVIHLYFPTELHVSARSLEGVPALPQTDILFYADREVPCARQNFEAALAGEC